MIRFAGMFTRLIVLLGRAYAAGKLDYETFEYAVRCKIALEDDLPSAVQQEVKQ